MIPAINYNSFLLLKQHFYKLNKGKNTKKILKVSKCYLISRDHIVFRYSKKSKIKLWNGQGECHYGHPTEKDSGISIEFGTVISSREDNTERASWTSNG